MQQVSFEEFLQRHADLIGFGARAEGKHGRVAVKVVDPRRNEVMAVEKLP